jgi:hypothetical protein
MLETMSHDAALSYLAAKERASAAHPHVKLKSTYFGPIHPEAPPFKNPEEDLRAIGIHQSTVIRHGKIGANGEFEATP